MLGAGSGLIGTTFLYPFYFVKRNLQAHSHEADFSMKKFAAGVWKEKGALGFYKGYSITAAKTMPYTAITFAVNEKLKVLLKYEKN